MNDRAKEASIISSCIVDYYIRFSDLHSKPVLINNYALMQISHFAKQGIKVRVK